jgi:hypothetical protein
MNTNHHLLWAPIKLVHFGAFSANLSSDMHLNIKGRQGYGCFRPDKDVVLAPTNEWLLGLAQATYLSEEGRREFDSAQERPVLLAFAGVFCSTPSGLPECPLRAGRRTNVCLSGMA